MDDGVVLAYLDLCHRSEEKGTDKGMRGSKGGRALLGFGRRLTRASVASKIVVGRGGYVWDREWWLIRRT